MTSALLSAYALAERQFGVASRQQLLALGVTEGSISHQLRRGLWRPVLSGAYDLHAAVNDDDTPWKGRLLAAQLVHPGTCAAVLASAGLVWDLPFCDQGIVHVAVPPGLEQIQRRGFRFHTWRVRSEDIRRVGPFLVTSPVRTLADLMLVTARADAVAMLDAALHHGHLDPQHDVRTIAAIMAGRRGCRRGRTYLEQLAVGAQSPLETRIRLIATDAGLAPDALQVPVHDRDGRLLGYGDIGWRTQRGWLIAECDGLAVHSLPRALAHDRRRQNDFLLEDGIGVVRFTWADSHRPAYVVNVLRRALSHI